MRPLHFDPRTLRERHRDGALAGSRIRVSTALTGPCQRLPGAVSVCSMTTMDRSLRQALKTCLRGCIAMVLLAGCDAGNAQRQTADEGAAVVPPVTVSGYCEKFALRYCALNALEYEARSARADKRTDVMTWIANVFQPADSRFTSEYDCRFRARRKGERAREISVGVYLTRTLHFAEYTKWEDLQIIPVEYVVDETHDRAGYGVFKYLDAP